VSLIFSLGCGFFLLLLYAKSDAGSAVLQPRMQAMRMRRPAHDREYVVSRKLSAYLMLGFDTDRHSADTRHSKYEI
jgi:hypothetical protein